MEQAVNTFQKGLLLDSNPMVQNNDSLSNALNATFITMNGNEVVLQNDMGNRRVDNAYLPSGYVPVGMKEYGGIIYVAAYNPLTNTSQVGSFPSPERNIGMEYDDLKFSIKLPLEENFNKSLLDSDVTGIKLLSLYSSLFPLSNDKIIIYPGDKFITYFVIEKTNPDETPNVLWTKLIENISNYDNIKKIGELYYVKNPKNKLFTISLGVLNSQNEFIDITNNLKRFDEDGNEFEDLDDKSEIIKFNSGYFIPNLSSKIKKIVPESDKEFLENRETSKLSKTNTYSYKLVGPLCLKILLNHIEDFNYTITGSKNNGKVELIVTGILTYNCPDVYEGVYEGDNISPVDNIYFSYDNDTLKSNYNKEWGFNIFINNQIPDDVEVEFTTPLYNSETNSYLIKIIKTYSNIAIPNDGKIKYYIGVPAYYNDDDVYLLEFWEEGEIDANLLGTGLVNLLELRFFNDIEQKNIIINYLFKTYPQENLEFTNLEISFSLNKISPLAEDYLKWYGIAEYVGKNVVNLNWDSITFSDTNNLDRKGNNFNKQLLWIHFKYNDSKNGIKCLYNQAFLLVTNLFNPCYVQGDDFINDFRKFSTFYYTSLSDNEQTIKNKYTTVNVNIEVDKESKLTEPSIEFDSKNSMILYNIPDPNINNKYIKLRFNHNSKIISSINNIEFKINENLPVGIDTININGNFESTTSINADYTCENDIKILSRGNTNSLTDTFKTDVEFSLNKSSNYRLSVFDISASLEFISKPVQKDIDVYHPFDLFLNMILNQVLDKYCGFYLSFNDNLSNDSAKLICSKNFKLNTSCNWNRRNNYNDYDSLVTVSLSLEIGLRNEIFNEGGLIYDIDSNTASEISTFLSNNCSELNFTMCYIGNDNSDVEDIKYLTSYVENKNDLKRLALTNNPNLYQSQYYNGILFWRYSISEWGILSSNIYNNSDESLKNILKNSVFKKYKNYRVSYKNQETYTKYVGDDSNYLHTESYELQIPVKYEIQFEDGDPDADKITISNNIEDFKIFTCGNVETSYTITDNLTLNVSNNKLSDLENKYIFNDPELIDINTGKIVDFYGNNLNEKIVYTEDLKPTDMNTFSADGNKFISPKTFNGTHNIKGLTCAVGDNNQKHITVLNFKDIKEVSLEGVTTTRPSSFS